MHFVQFTVKNINKEAQGGFYILFLIYNIVITLNCYFFRVHRLFKTNNSKLDDQICVFPTGQVK